MYWKFCHADRVDSHVRSHTLADRVDRHTDNSAKRKGGTRWWWWKKIRKRECRGKKTLKTRLAVEKLFGWRYLAQQFKLPSKSKTTAHHTYRHTHHTLTSGEKEWLARNLKLCIITKHTTFQWGHKFWELLRKHLIQFSCGSYMLKRQLYIYFYYCVHPPTHAMTRRSIPYELWCPFTHTHTHKRHTRPQTHVSRAHYTPNK